MMTKPIFSIEKDASGAQIRSFAYDVDQMMSVEGEFERDSGLQSPLKKLYRYWMQTSMFDPHQYEDIWIQYIDTYAESPLAYVWYRHTGLTFGDLSGRDVGSLAHPVLRDACVQEYATIKKLARPVYHRITQTIDGIYRDYARLMIPGSNDVLYYVYRLITPPNPVGFTGQEHA